jgi:hypothetical protein
LLELDVLLKRVMLPEQMLLADQVHQLCPLQERLLLRQPLIKLTS